MACSVVVSLMYMYVFQAKDGMFCGDLSDVYVCVPGYRWHVLW